MRVVDGRSGLMAFAVGEFVRELVAQQQRCEPRFTLTPSWPDKPMLSAAMATAGGRVFGVDPCGSGDSSAPTDKVPAQQNPRPLKERNEFRSGRVVPCGEGTERPRPSGGASGIISRLLTRLATTVSTCRPPRQRRSPRYPCGGDSAAGGRWRHERRRNFVV